jgi:hypothetical protein
MWIARLVGVASYYQSRNFWWQWRARHGASQYDVERGKQYSSVQEVGDHLDAAAVQLWPRRTQPLASHLRSFSDAQHDRGIGRIEVECDNPRPELFFALVSGLVGLAYPSPDQHLRRAIHWNRDSLCPCNGPGVLPDRSSGYAHSPAFRGLCRKPFAPGLAQPLAPGSAPPQERTIDSHSPSSKLIYGTEHLCCLHDL